MSTAAPDSSADAAREDALTRLEALEREVEQLADHVRAVTARLQADLSRTRASVHELHAAGGAARIEPPVGGEAPAVADEPPPTEPTPLAEPPIGGDAPEGADEGARLVALDLVMRGTDRAAAERELRASFPGVDAGPLLDEAAATLGA